MNRADSEESPMETNSTASVIESTSDSLVSHPEKKKKKHIKKFRKFVKKLIKEKKKDRNSEEAVHESEGGPSTSSPVLKNLKWTKSLTSIEEEPSVLPTTKSIDENTGDKKSKKVNAIAASFVKKVTSRKSKVTLNPTNAIALDENSASTSETPPSIEARTPDEASLSVPEISSSAESIILSSGVPVIDSEILSDNSDQSKSFEEYGSREAPESTSFDESSLNEYLCRRASNVEQPMLFTPEEAEMVSGRPSLLFSIAGKSPLVSEEFLESNVSRRVKWFPTNV